MLDREELIAETMRLRSQHAELQQRAEVQRKVSLTSQINFAAITLRNECL